MNGVDSSTSVNLTRPNGSIDVGNDDDVHNVTGERKNGTTLHMRRNKSVGQLSNEDKLEGRVLVLYTGGTIGMTRNEKGVLRPMPNTFVKNLRKYPQMHERAYADERFGAMGPLVLPMAYMDKRRIIYNVLEYSPLLDSSNMTVDDWIKIATDIRESYEFFDGFVILHGTDTLSYTASALSFMLESLGKTVVITGSQLPIFDTRSDGLDNFLSSLVIAGNYNIPEVCVFFGTRLMRGNRTSKISADSFDAFHSPNSPPLAQAGIEIQVDYKAIFRPCTLEKFHVNTSLIRSVGLLRLFPSITLTLVRAFLQPPIEGVVLQTYGSGNIPNNRDDIVDELRAATARNVIIINITQCSEGCVNDTYESGKQLVEAGVTPGFDMTPEAALAKLSYVLSKTEWDTETKRLMMQTNLRGELTAGRPTPMKDWDLVDAVARSLHLSSPAELQELGSVLFPAMLNAAVMARDISKIESLKGYGADISQTNSDARTALHIACCEGDLQIVRRLLQMGANVHMKDRYAQTPLTDAIKHDHHDLIKLLLQSGAHLHGSARLIGEQMCSAAAAGNVRRLRSYHLAGADLSQEDISGRTALHLGALHNRENVVRFLLDHGADPNCVDKLGDTPGDLADRARSARVIGLLPARKAIRKTTAERATATQTDSDEKIDIKFED